MASDGQDVSQVQFNSIPFYDNADGSIHVAGMYPANWSFSSFRSGNVQNLDSGGLQNLVYSGECDTSGTTWIVSILNFTPECNSIECLRKKYLFSNSV